VKGLANYGKTATYASLPPLFNNVEEYNEFKKRHAKASVPRVDFDENTGPVHIGIDSGSTTIKVAVIDDNANLLYTDYQSNSGNPLPIVIDVLKGLYEAHPNLKIQSVTTTGYGEALMTHALHTDFGLVETVAHFTAAKHFMPDVDFIIDIGGQDMKCFKIENGAISDIFLNEACSSGCGSFLQTFSEALGYSVKNFAQEALFAKHPVDLGSRCTVFMNSSVKQAQKDGAGFDCISAGLSISVVKNALYKVIRTSSPEQLGKKIVVQGGTFYNEAVLRAFEKEMGVDVVRPDIAGLMGAYGAALHGKEHSKPGTTSSILTLEELNNFTQKVQNVQCGLCGNHCQMTVSVFQDGKRFITGNRCDRPITGKSNDDTLNLYAYKQQQLSQLMKNPGTGTRGKIGIPMVLNMYELLPFWHAFFTNLGFQVIVSPFSNRKLYQAGQGSIPSDTVCFPAKLTHGHIMALLKKDVDAIFYPCMSYNVDEGLGDNHYNCPVVAYYPEVLAGNIRELEDTKFIYEYLNLEQRKDFVRLMPKIMQKYYPDLKTSDIHNAIEVAYTAYRKHMEDTRKEAERMMTEARNEGKRIIVLAGRPYHVDPEVNHGIDKLIVQHGACVITEDSISNLVQKFDTSVLNQWSYHSRLYAAAKYCVNHADMDLIQLVSFGCGLDAVTSDETKEILQEGNKLYTQLKIDEITNLGAVNIRIRSLFAALDERKEQA
ncbi:MAG: 2-hydroxyacyl-CoA dehydratase, partial [Solobacterium sp.]|nr:2-hydroxyacyl-CoA dehydratase [Solobacterium sp.]